LVILFDREIIRDNALNAMYHDVHYATPFLARLSGDMGFTALDLASACVAYWNLEVITPGC